MLRYCGACIDLKQCRATITTEQVLTWICYADGFGSGGEEGSDFDVEGGTKGFIHLGAHKIPDYSKLFKTKLL
jgi:hypothetical protein